MFMLDGSLKQSMLSKEKGKSSDMNQQIIIWVFLKIGVPQNGWCIMENHAKTLLKWMILD